MATNQAQSQHYTKKPYLYWWDVWDSRKNAIRRGLPAVVVGREMSFHTAGKPRRATRHGQDAHATPGYSGLRYRWGV